MSLDTSKTYKTRNGEHRDLRVVPWERRGGQLRKIYDAYTFLVCGTGATSSMIEGWVTTADGHYYEHNPEHPLDLIEQEAASFQLEDGKTYVTRKGDDTVKVAADVYLADPRWQFVGVEGRLAGCHFTREGYFWTEPHHDCPLDLVAEAPAVEASVEAGDRTMPLETADITLGSSGSVSVSGDLSIEGVIAGKPDKLTDNQAYRTRDARFGGIFVAKNNDVLGDKYPWRVVAAQDGCMIGRSYTKRGFFISKHEPGGLDLVPDDGVRNVPVPAPKPEPELKEIVAELPPSEPTSIELKGEVGSVEWLQGIVDAAKSGQTIDMMVGGIMHRGCKVEVLSGDVSKFDVKAAAASAKVTPGAWGPWGIRPLTMGGADTWSQPVKAQTWVTLCDHLGTEGFLVAIDEETKRGFVRHSGDTHSIKLDRLRPAPWKPRVGEPATWGNGSFSMTLYKLNGPNAIMRRAGTTTATVAECSVPLRALYQPRPDTQAA